MAFLLMGHLFNYNIAVTFGLTIDEIYVYEDLSVLLAPQCKELFTMCFLIGWFC